MRVAQDTYLMMRQRFPNKHIVVGEIGWPSNGDRRERAYPSISNEAIFDREWLIWAKAHDVDYYLLEAFDQPWKESLGEGRTGAYWGIFDADRQPKFPFTGPVTEDTGWPWKALAASLLALIPMIWFGIRFSRFKPMGRLFFDFLIQLACGLIVWSVTLPFNFYLDWIDWSMLVLLFPAQLAILAILLINGFEFTEVLWRREWIRHAGMLKPDPVEKQPFVSIHLACYNEPPEMVIVTLDSLAALDYQNYEVLVIDNNTKDPAIWQPVQEYCEKLGKRFRFFHLEPWPGFKAGALNFGLKETDPRADVVAVIDADYEVRADWLATLTGYFHDPKVAVVQCPQAHRDFEHNRFRRMTAWEYDGFFRIGMHHRNERNAIIQHGTMTMVRRSALEGTGGWSEWTICEDAELGLRLMHAGYELVYVDELMGKGLTPADFKAYKSQRYRWAFGAMQILKGRWSWMTKKGPLTGGQRFHFLTGWFSWFADALHLIFTLMAIFWTAGMVGAAAALQPADAAVPDSRDRLLLRQGDLRLRAVSRPRALQLVRHHHGLGRQHEPQPRDRARHPAWPYAREDVVRGDCQEPTPGRQQLRRLRPGARGDADGLRAHAVHHRHGNEHCIALHRRPVVDVHPGRAGDSVYVGTGRRMDRA